MGILVLLLILGIYVVRPGDWMLGADFRWNLVLNVVGAVALVGLLVSGKARNSWDRSWLFLLAFFLLMMVSSIVMGQFDTIPDYAPQMMTNILVYLLICSAVQNQGQLSLVTGGFGILALFVAYQCHVQIETGANIAGAEPLVRVSEQFDEQGLVSRDYALQAEWLGVFEDPNDTGLLLITVLPLFAVYAIFLGKGMFRRLVAGAASAMLIYGVYLTNSRGTFVALMGAVGYFFILRYRSVKGLIAASIGGFALITVGPSRMASLSAADDSAMERVYAWIEALWAFSMYPFFGLGPKHWRDFHHKTTHNSFVLAFVENGFVAYICWLAVVLIPLWLVSRGAFQSQDMRERTGYAAFGACLAGVMLSIFFISRTYVLIPYFITACTLTYCRVADQPAYAANIRLTTPVNLAAVAAASVVLIWIVNILTTRLML